MEMQIGTTNVEESNDFLRCLWAEMAREFGKCGWQYMPHKEGSINLIFFGFMDIGQEVPIQVSITYKQKGSINNLYFFLSKKERDSDEDITISMESELYERLHKVVKITKENVGKVGYGYVSQAFHAYVPLWSYRGNNFAIEAMENGKTKFSCVVKAYDENQSRGYMRQKVNQLVDFLSVETNAPFRLPKVPCMDKTIKFENELFQNEDFIDDLSIKNDYLVISKEGKEFINKLTSVEKELSPEIDIFLKACSHFHSARMQEEQMYDSGKGIVLTMFGGNKIEQATTLYLSALEVLSLIGFEEDKCESCGQPKYQITKRVRELTSRYLPKHLVKDFVDYYDKRSKYLHTGMKLVTETPTSSLIPLLDPEDKNGCDYPYKIPLENVREYVSYCLRKFYKENLIK
jgi:hypothetical protein